MRAKLFCLIFLSIAFLFLFGLEGSAIDKVASAIEVIVPAQGLTELDLKNQICLYQGHLGAPVRVVISSPQMRLSAVQIVYDLENRSLVAEKQVEWQAEKAGLQATSEKMTVTAELVQLPTGGEITFAQEEMRLVIKGDFCYQVPETTYQATGGFFLSGPDWTLEGQDLEGNLNNSSFVASGALSFTHQQVEGEGEVISYDKNEGTMVLSGSPVFRWESGWLHGEAETVIIYYLETGKVKTEGPTKIRFAQEMGVNPDGN